MSCCPLCGGVMDDGAMWFVKDRGLVGRGDRQVVLPYREAELLWLLFKARPRVLTHAALMDQLYQLADETPEQKIIDVFVCRLRKKIKHLGLRIETHWGKCYALAFEAAEPFKITMLDEG